MAELPPFPTIITFLSFSAALLSAFGFYCFTRNPLDKGWQKIGTLGFRIHSFAVLGIILTLFYILTNHLFEYNYAWQHSNKAMPMRYLLSCFWEGQEGSFLLWTFWHLILGNILIRKAGEYALNIVNSDPNLSKSEHEAIKNRFNKDYSHMLEYLKTG